ASPEFWWMNNGATIICSSATINGKEFVLDDVQVVNGLQTSYTIFEVLRK
ncbi:AIPR family protein, partial [Saccharothrix algeriensis]